MARNPENIALEITPENGDSQFYPGQTIMLTMQFTGANADKYRAWQMTDRTGAGRVAQDVFHLDPADGAADPFAGYQLSRGFGGEGGGPYHTLDRSFTLELNNWLRFEKPGKYRLFVETVRLFPGMPRGAQRPTIGAASNILELEILPSDKDWIHSQQAAAVAALAATRTTPGIPDSRSTVLQRAEAIRTLKNLQTEDAARALLDRLTVPNTDNSVTGAVALALYASRHRSIVIDGLREICADPETAPQSAVDLLKMLTTPAAGSPN